MTPCSARTNCSFSPWASTRLKVRMPYLRSLVKDGKIAISNAQLVFENPDKDSALALPDALSLYMLDKYRRLRFRDRPK
ncbi:MAG: hypothetical protein MZV63_55490 [Marinilabiliales bacterium]|nr:hypothetical protein [Marinilabiliales bacterium]